VSWSPEEPAKAVPPAHKSTAIAVDAKNRSKRTPVIAFFSLSTPIERQICPNQALKRQNHNADQGNNPRSRYLTAVNFLWNSLYVEPDVFVVEE
jgi:hypothetical protein